MWVVRVRNLSILNYKYYGNHVTNCSQLVSLQRKQDINATAIVNLIHTIGTEDNDFHKLRPHSSIIKTAIHRWKFSMMCVLVFKLIY